MNQENDTTQAESVASPEKWQASMGLPAWLEVGAIAAASAVVGGVAAAWYYRKTLDRLREAESNGGNPEFRIPDSETEYEI